MFNKETSTYMYILGVLHTKASGCFIPRVLILNCMHIPGERVPLTRRREVVGGGADADTEQKNKSNILSINTMSKI